MGCFCEEQSFNLSVWLGAAGGGWRVEESDDFSGTGNLAPHSGVTSRGGPGVEICQIMDRSVERDVMKDLMWSTEDVIELLQHKEDLIRR